jgi:hypothetical protein
LLPPGLPHDASPVQCHAEASVYFGNITAHGRFEGAF